MTVERPDLDSENTDEQRLDSWKEIASHLERGVRTVQRWERFEGLPVRRHQHDKRGTVFAFRSEIDDWRSRREEDGPLDPDFAGDGPQKTSSRLWLALGAAAVAAIALAVTYSGASSSSSPDSDWTIRPITADRGHEHHPTISPDGTQIAYAWHAREREAPQIYLQPRASGPRRRLTSEDQAEVSPVWSPDGRYIAAGVRTAAGERHVALIVLETGAQRLILQPTATSGGRFLAWAPDSQRLLLAASLDDKPPRILSYRLSDGAVEEVISDPQRALFGPPAVSPDGRKVAFAQWTSDSVSEIYLADVDADLRPLGKPRPLTNAASTSAHPVFSADGTEVLYRSGWLVSRGVWRIPTAGGEPTRAAPAAEGVDEFAYHPTEGLLLFSRVNLAMDIWRQPLCDCPDERKPFIESTLHDLNAKVSPDGSRVAFASDRSGLFQIWTADVDGTDLRQVTDFGDTMTGTPRWSPDSRLLAFDSRPDGHSDIFVVAADGGQPRRLTVDSADDVTPGWSADGRWVYFGSDRGGSYQIWRAPSAGGEAEQVTRDGGFTAAGSPNGETLYFAKRIRATTGTNAEVVGPKSTSLWRMPATGGEATLIAENIWDWSKFVPTDEGVYYVTCRRTESCSVFLYRLGTGETTKVAKTPPELETGFDVLADGSLIYSMAQASESDLLLVEGFR